MGTLSIRRIITKTVLTVIFTGLGIVMIAPFLWMLSASFKLQSEIFKAPIEVSLLILSFTWHWNEYEGPLIVLRTNSLYTLRLALTNFVDENTTNYTAVMAASVSSLLPLIILVAFFQRWFVGGITSSGVKG